MVTPSLKSWSPKTMHSPLILQFVWKSCQFCLRSMSRISHLLTTSTDILVKPQSFLPGFSHSSLLLPLLPDSPFSTAQPEWPLMYVLSCHYSAHDHSMISHLTQKRAKEWASASHHSITTLLPYWPITSSLVHSALATLVSSLIFTHQGPRAFAHACFIPWNAHFPQAFRLLLKYDLREACFNYLVEIWSPISPAPHITPFLLYFSS